MGYNFKPLNREQMYLLPLSLRDWIPQDDPVWLVIESVEAMDLSAFYQDVARHRVVIVLGVNPPPARPSAGYV